MDQDQLLDYAQGQVEFAAGEELSPSCALLLRKTFQEEAEDFAEGQRLWNRMRTTFTHLLWIIGVKAKQSADGVPINEEALQEGIKEVQAPCPIC